MEAMKYDANGILFVRKGSKEESSVKIRRNSHCRHVNLSS